MTPELRRLDKELQAELAALEEAVWQAKTFDQYQLMRGKYEAFSKTRQLVEELAASKKEED